MGKDGALWRIRTTGLLIRSQMLYPAELRAHARGDTVPNLESFSRQGEGKVRGLTPYNNCWEQMTLITPENNSLTPLIIGKDPGYLTTAANGRVAEWLMAPVLKTGVPERVSGVRIPSLPPHLSLLGGHRGGSVPSHIGMFVVKICVVPVRRDGRVAEGARLESVYRLIPYRGFESPSLRHYFPLGALAQGLHFPLGALAQGLPHFPLGALAQGLPPLNWEGGHS